MAYEPRPEDEGGGGGGVSVDTPIITIAADDTLTAERSLAVETGVLSLTDGGVNSTLTIGVASSGIGTAKIADLNVTSGKIADNAVTDAKLRDSAALSVIGRSANSSGDPADIAAANDGEVLRRSGTTVGFGTVATAGVADNAITDGKLRDSAALSVIGRSANTSGDPADITAANDAEVLRRNGTSIGFGTVATAGIADNAISNAKLRDSAGLSVIGRGAGDTGDPADITAGSDGEVLRRSGTTLGFGTVASGGIADDAVTDAKLRNSSALSVIGRSANSTGDPADIAASADGDVLRRSGTTLGFGAIPQASVTNLTTSLAAKASLTSGKVPTSELGTGTADSTTFLRGDQSWAAPSLDINGMTAVATVQPFSDYLAGYDTSATANRKMTPFDLLRASNFFYTRDDCMADGTDDRADSWITSGTSRTTEPSTTDHIGILKMTANGSHVVLRTGAGFGGALVKLGGGIWHFETCIKTPSALSSGTNPYELVFGFNDNGSSGGASATSQGCYLYYFHSVSTQWQLRCKNGGSVATSLTGVTVTVDTWVRLGFVVNANASSVQAYVNGTAAGSAVTTQIPTGTMDVHCSIYEQNAAANRILYIDYAEAAWQPTTPR